jgi:hypothetical protein
MLPNEIEHNAAVDVTGGFTRGNAKIIEINFAQAVMGFVVISNYITQQMPVQRIFEFYAEDSNRHPK